MFGSTLMGHLWGIWGAKYRLTRTLHGDYTDFARTLHGNFMEF